MLRKKNALLEQHKNDPKPLDHYFSLKPPNAKGEGEGRFFTVQQENEETAATDAGDDELNNMFAEALKSLDDPDAIKVPDPKSEEAPENKEAQSEEPAAAATPDDDSSSGSKAETTS